MSIYENLANAAASDPKFLGKKDKETDQEFLRRMVDGIANVPEDIWEALPEDAKAWYDDCLDADGKHKSSLELPEGYSVSTVPVEEEVPTSNRRRPVKSLTVYDQLVLTVTQKDPNSGPQHLRESDQAYFARLLQGLGDDIPKSIADWVTAADTAMEKGKPITPPVGFLSNKLKKESIEQAAEPQSVAGAASKAVLSPIEEYNRKLAAGEVPPRTRRKSAADKPAKAPKVAKVKEPKRMGRIVRADSATALIRDAVAANLSVSIEDLLALLRESGKPTDSVATVTTTRASHLAAIRSLQRQPIEVLTDLFPQFKDRQPEV